MLLFFSIEEKNIVMHILKVLNLTISLISDMAPTTDPTDFSKLRSIKPINNDPDAPPPTFWERMKHNFNMFMEVSKNRPLGETLCLKEALILGK